ncbi:hypothetical protein [Cohnella algarum]|uniref:hypothetical protein n=1 Tax=Cohnella algarum TaxID=2044859 RepID=UPI00196786E6|nr:hypothetical protein [Cohnella algarum]MBN2983381.1 hypothetical protein [Cohnella algarum]
MNRVACVVRSHSRDKWSWYVLPWFVVGMAFVINWAIGALAAEGDVIQTGGIASIFVYMFVSGCISVTQSFPFLISLSVRRRDYFLGTTIMASAVCLGSAILLYALTEIEKATGSWGIGMRFFTIPWIDSIPDVGRIWMYLIVLLLMFFLGFFISCWHRRFGRIGLWLLSIGIFAAVTLALVLTTRYERWDDLGRFLGGFSPLGLISWLAAPTALLFAGSYLLLRKATV